MNLKIKTLSILFIVFLFQINIFAQEKHYYQTDFSIQDFNERRTKIFDAIGTNGIALIQGARSVDGFEAFRQTNTFYYLTGIETGHAYLLFSGKRKTTTLYLPHRDTGRERSQGKILSAEDAELIIKLTGVNQVKAIEFLSSDLAGSGLIKDGVPILYTPLSPAETGTDSRDELVHGQARAASDPWDGQASREAHFKRLLNERFPQFVIKDLSPTLDDMRLIKSKKEIEIIRKATQIAGLAIIEAMKSTKAGVYEYQLAAAAKYIFYQHDAQGDAYPAIIGGGTNAFMGHYFHKTDVLKNGDLVLMDYAPDYKYYTSDVTRIWPVNGKFDKAQTALYEYIIAYKDALFKYIKPGVTANYVLDKASADMKNYLKGKKFANPNHLKAVQKGIKFRGHFQHPVGMGVHDVGRVRGNVVLKEGMVFTIDPMIWITEERLYVRIEDVAVITATGVENMSAFVPTTIKEIEKTIKEKGITEFRPAKKLPLKK
ncbi:Xaa-Pro peptidase family protein [Polaribacter uvawellassae]|uniref:Xaa-Pro peptidase family protein n=1 Tax=Polaribacter uvawellassae TaxID=3133495 RepID=UPI00321B3128